MTRHRLITALTLCLLPLTACGPETAPQSSEQTTTTATARLRANMGSYTFRWYVISAPLLPFEKGKDVSSAMEPRRASELGSSWRWWSCRLASPAGCSVVQCYLLRYRQPTHAQIFTPILHQTHLILLTTRLLTAAAST